MAIADEIVDFKTSQITALSLHLGDPGSTGANEVTGNGYTRLAPTYPASSGGSTDLASPLEFQGPVSEGPVTYVGYWKGETFWTSRPVDETGLEEHRFFNSHGRVNILSAIIDAFTA